MLHRNAPGFLMQMTIVTDECPVAIE